MPTKDDPAHPLPQFLTARAEQGPGNALEGPAAASRAVKASVLIAAAAATGLAVLAMGNPVALVADMSASLVGNSPPQSTPTIQAAADAPVLIPSTADVQALPAATETAPVRDEIAVSEPAGKDQMEKSEASSETLFRQFQAWAAEQDAQPRGEPVQQAQDTPTQVVPNVPARAAEDVRAPHRPVQKRRHVRGVRDARAEMRTKNFRKQVRQAQRARAERQPIAERPPIQDARAQDQSGQNAQAPSFQSIFGARN